MKLILAVFLFSALVVASPYYSFSQNKEVLVGVDSTKTITAVVDSSSDGKEKIKKIKIYNPKKAAIRSAIIPGWGQVYNEKYWKVPIVYAALGVTGETILG